MVSKRLTRGDLALFSVHQIWCPMVSRRCTPWSGDRESLFHARASYFRPTRLRCICMPNISALWVDRRQDGGEFAFAVDTAVTFIRHSPPFVHDSRQAWMRLAVAVLIGSLGSVGMWSVVVALPAVQSEFAATRGTASLAFTLVMLGFGSGGVLTGKITDRYGIVAAIGFGIGILGLGYIGAGLSSSIWQFILLHFAIGIGASGTFGPLMAEASHWFDRYR